MVFVAIMAWAGCHETLVIYPERKEIIETVYASGKIVPENEYKLFALRNGTITRKLVQDGDTVTAGQLLYIIKDEAARERYDAAYKNYEVARENLSGRSPLLNDVKLSLHNAEVKFRNDSVTYYRWKNLWDKDIGTQSNLDNALGNYQVSYNQKKMAEFRYHSTLSELTVSYSNALSQLAAARNDLQEYYIRSDRAGIVFQTFKEAGEAVYSNEVMALLGDPRQRILRLAVDQEDIIRVRPGQQVLVQSDVTRSNIYPATITYVYPVMNETDQTFRVDARFRELPAEFFVHSSIEANIIVQRKSNALVIPRNAMRGRDSVWIRLNGKQIMVPVRTGISTLDHVEILSGIDENTAVLLTPKS